jgi:thiamine biosynthesis lipoprotein
MSETCSPSLDGAGLAATLARLGFEAATPALRLDEAVPAGHGTFRISGSAAAMRTRVAITVVHPSRHRAEEAVGRAFEEMGRVVALLNRHDGASAISALNEKGVLPGAPAALTEVLTEAARMHRISSGAFDVTVQPLVDLLRGMGAKRVARAARPEVAEARALVDMSALHVSKGAVRLAKAGMGLTLDGIAKGYVVDRMAAVLRAHDARDWLIDAGGDIRVSGANEAGRPWRIGVQDPHKRGAFPDVTELREGAIATSGGYEDPFAPDGTTHHIVDAATGRSPTRILSASVTAPTAIMADALATAALVLPPQGAVALIETLPRCTCLLLDSDGRDWRSRQWRTVTQSNH